MGTSTSSGNTARSKYLRRSSGESASRLTFIVRESASLRSVASRRMKAESLGEIEGARQVEIPGVAQMGNMEKPRELNRIVIDFLSGE